MLFDVDLDPQYLISTKDNIFEKFKINLIDFGFATEYIDKDTGKHLTKKLEEVFRGNKEFASINQMKFYTTSRRDDLISLFYLMIYMLKRGKMPGFGNRTILTNPY